MSLGVRHSAEIDGVAKYQGILGRILEAVIVRVARQGDVRTETARSENWRVTANLDLSPYISLSSAGRRPMPRGRHWKLRPIQNRMLLSHLAVAQKVVLPVEGN
jgi:hypothetical protein